MKKIISLIMCISILVTSFITASANNSSVNLLQNLNIMNGYADGSFRLENTVTRAEFTKMIISASKYKNFVAPSVSVSTFVDVTHKYWAAPYILVAFENRIISGYLDATFKPNQTIKYEEAITVIIKLLGYTEEDYGNSWPYGQMNLAEDIGLTKGVECSLGQNLTRKDISSLIANMLIVKNKSNTFYGETLGYKITTKANVISVDDMLIYTNTGSFKCKNQIDSSFAGTTGTLVLNQDDEVLGYITEQEISKTDVIVGVVSEVGAKEFTNNGKTTKEYYAKIVSCDGASVDYKTKTPYNNLKNSVVSVSFDEGYAKLNRVSNKIDFSGYFNYEEKMFNNKLISSDIKILDIYSTSSNDPNLYASITPQRIDGVSLSSSNVLYYEEDDKGRVAKLILKNVTSDMLKYGIMVKAKNTSEEDYMSGSYKYDIGGTVYELETTDKMYTSVSSGTPIKAIIENEELKSMQSLTLANGSISKLTPQSAKIGNTTYKVSPDVCVYVKNYYGTYLIMELEDLIQKIDDYSVSAYYDKTTKSGGCVRVLVVREK